MNNIKNNKDAFVFNDEELLKVTGGQEHIYCYQIKTKKGCNAISYCQWDENVKSNNCIIKLGK